MTLKEARTKARHLRQEGHQVVILRHEGVATCPSRRQLVSYCYHSVKITGRASA